ncbi:MAG: NBR1-Ig-like domain-containing protein [Chloroflexi bacterium]|nr:NBR1-Ig-like domain-containing protein [Chloroflexota bacterium]
MHLNKHNIHKILGLAFTALIVLSACRAPTQETSPTQDINALYTQVAGTLIAQGQVATEAPAATNTPLVTTATPSPSQPTATASNTPVPVTNTPAAVCNQAAFISDVTVKDGTKMSKGEDFTKTWRIKNTGTCTWDEDYTVVFSSGTNLANKASYDLSEDVSPGETVNISIPMEAPDKNGTYTSNWVIRSDSGATFGVGGSGGSAGVPFFALIKVGTGGTTSSGKIKYDFADNFCDADWDSHSKNNLPCPGANQGDNGFVLVLQDPELETGVKENEPAIWMRPSHEGNGWIRGVFPDYEVKDDDHFVATIGCLDNNPNCRVTFTLSYIKPNGDEVVLGTWDEKFDELVRDIDIDLSSLAGKELNFVLTVDTGNNNFAQANAFWFVPMIENQ